MAISKNAFKLQSAPKAATVRQILEAGEYNASGVVRVNAEIKVGKDGSSNIMASAVIALEGKRAAAVMDRPVAYTQNFFISESDFDSESGRAVSRGQEFLLRLASVCGLTEVLVDPATGAEYNSIAAPVWEDLREALPDDVEGIDCLLILIENLGQLMVAAREPFNVMVTHRTYKEVTSAQVSAVLPFVDLGGE